MTAAGLGCFLAALWIVPAALGFTVGGRRTEDSLLLVAIMVAAVPFIIGSVGLFLRKNFGRWTLLAGFVLAIPESLPVLVIVGVVTSIPVAVASGVVAVLVAVAGIVLVSIRPTGRYLQPMIAPGIPSR